MSRFEECWLTPQMRIYVLFTLMYFRKKEIKCDQCGEYNGIHIHHLDYEYPTIDDLQLLCDKCHKEAHGKNHYKRDNTILSTVFENGKRYCKTSNDMYEY